MATGADDGLEFDRLLRPHVPALYRYAYRWTGSEDRAEDLVQEVLLRLFPRLEELRRIERPRPWAAKIMYRLFVDGLRRERRSPVDYLDRDEWSEPADESLEPSLLADREIGDEQLLAAWSTLSDEHRAVLSLHDVEGYSLIEVAGIVDAPVGTLKSRLHRARARLRERLLEGTSARRAACVGHG